MWFKSLTLDKTTLVQYPASLSTIFNITISHFTTSLGILRDYCVFCECMCFCRIWIALSKTAVSVVNAEPKFLRKNGWSLIYFFMLWSLTPTGRCVSLLNAPKFMNHPLDKQSCKLMTLDKYAFCNFNNDKAVFC